MKIKLGDEVIVTTGKDKGKKGKVLKVLPKKNMVVVEGVNQVVKHIKPYAGRSGERKTIQKPILVSKVAILNDKGQPDRVGYRIEKDGTKVRIFKKTGKIIPEKKESK